MLPFGWAVIAIVAILIVLLIFLYNSLVRKKMHVTEAWASIDVQLKRKSNVLQNLVDTIKMQTDYESDLLLKITNARTALMTGTSEDRMKTNDAISKMIPSIYAVSENYPQLGANESFRQLMTSVEDCENKIAYARTRYNISVTSYNTALLVFPQSLVAKLFGFSSEKAFELEEADRMQADNLRIKDLS